MKPKRLWTSEDDSKLKRLNAAGLSDGEIGPILKRDRAQICRRRHKLGLQPGISPAMQAVLARLSLRRLQSRAAA